ncbi:Alpha/Beta hydrolase protein [Absidia repens]|uniref:Alpha/Beta hydrolase protein n=1 Tax=Absidia repens TaxID=90262 RepID=A0A1X2IZS2_9FUNG|nr:Alpha/Beta hydrolase protein [Absidia repens]
MQRQFFLLSRRTYATSSAKAVRLAFDKYPAKVVANQTTKSPLIICHGLFGSKQNWASLCRAAAQRIQRDIYAVDLRNHGDSPHDKRHDFGAMAQDLLVFMKEQQLEQPILMGHSMGGKAVMTAALEQPTLVSKVISVDMPPVPLQLSRGFATYIEGMQEVDRAKCTKQSQADVILQKYESNPGIRMFLLTNLKRQVDPSNNNNNVLSFRLPLTILANALSNVGAFPTDTINGNTYDGPTLFIGGEKKAAIKSYFPHSQLEVVQGAGHWVHAEKPDQVLRLITSFCQEN